MQEKAFGTLCPFYLLPLLYLGKKKKKNQPRNVASSVSVLTSNPHTIQPSHHLSRYVEPDKQLDEKIHLLSSSVLIKQTTQSQLHTQAVTPEPNPLSSWFSSHSSHLPPDHIICIPLRCHCLQSDCNPSLGELIPYY